jgi:hypothetical protein
MLKDPFIRENFTKLRMAAREFAAEHFERYPKNRYLTEVEGWRHLQSRSRQKTVGAQPRVSVRLAENEEQGMANIKIIRHWGIAILLSAVAISAGAVA